MSLANLWEFMYERFGIMFPSLVEKTVEWWPSGRREITMRLDDETRVIYDDITGSARFIKQERVEANNGDEDKWRVHFAYKLNRKIYECGLQHKDVAEQIGISSQMLSRYCNGSSTPSFFVIKKLANVLQCSVTELTEFVDVE